MFTNDYYGLDECAQGIMITATGAQVPGALHTGTT